MNPLASLFFSFFLLSFFLSFFCPCYFFWVLSPLLFPKCHGVHYSVLPYLRQEKKNERAIEMTVVRPGGFSPLSQGSTGRPKAELCRWVVLVLCSFLSGFPLLFANTVVWRSLKSAIPALHQGGERANQCKQSPRKPCIPLSHLPRLFFVHMSSISFSI